MKKTIKYLKTQNTLTENNIREEIKNFRDQRLEEQQGQNNVMTYRSI